MFAAARRRSSDAIHSMFKANDSAYNKSFAHLHERRRRHTQEVLKSNSTGLLPQLKSLSLADDRQRGPMGLLLNRSPLVGSFDHARRLRRSTVAEEGEEEELDMGVVDLGDVVDVVLPQRSFSDPNLAEPSLMLYEADEEGERGDDEDSIDEFDFHYQVQMKD